MSMMLNFITTTLEHGRRLHHLGRPQEAIAVFQRLVGLESLSRTVAEELHVRLAELHLTCHDYRTARRHLLVALAYHPTNARYHHLLATAIELDPRATPARAARHYVQSLKLDANRPLCYHDLGWLRIRMGRVNAGLRLLARAVKMDTSEPRYLAALTTALLEAGKVSLAWKFMLRARFQNRNDIRFVQLWDRFRFDAARAEQQSTGEVPVKTLPFVPAEPKTVSIRGRRGRLVRMDSVSKPQPHFFAWKADSRRLS